MHQPGIVGPVGGGVGVGEGTAVGDGAIDVSVAVGAGGTVFVAVGDTVEVTVGVRLAAGVEVLVLVGTGGKGVFVGGGAVGTVCALAVPTQPDELAARITTPRTSATATMIRGDSMLRTCVIFASL